MASINVTRRPLVVLDLPRRISNVISFATTVAADLKGNAALPSPTPTWATFEADIAALQSAEAAALTRAKGAAQERNVKLVVVKGDLELLAAYVQSVADTNLTTAQALIESAGFGVKKVPDRTKQDLAVRAGRVAGSVILTAKAVAHRASYEWEYSADQKTWMMLPPTLQSKTSLSGLTPGSTYYFQIRTVTRLGQSDWGTPVPYTVPLPA